MTNIERYIIYPLFSLLLLYSIWAYGRLQTIYRINTDRLIPAYKQLQNPPREHNYLKLREEVLTNVILERFELKVWEKRVNEWDFVCHRWVRSPLPYMTKSKNIVKFYSHNGTMLKWEIFYADEPWETDYPRESTKLITLPISIAELVDCNQTELMFRPCVDI